MTTKNSNILGYFPRHILEKYRAFPDSINGDTIQMLMENPKDKEATDILSFASDYEIIGLKSEKSRISKLLEDNNTSKSDFSNATGSLTSLMKESRLNKSISDNPEDLKKSGQAEPVVKMVDLIIDEAIKVGASDIHIEPQEDKVSIRNRIDGILIESVELPDWMGSAVTSRIKILADLDIAEKRVPQDGRIKREHNGTNVDLRISTLPTHFGEKSVIRILRHNADLFSLENLGFTDSEIKYLNEIINLPQGIIFVTGPTGSGKSSSLFAFLNRIKDKNINITTIENPIEIKLSKINQVQINEKAGLTFASTLRSILRQDPDVILIGEIRDKETAEIATQAAQTGHLVFSTLHTNDAASALTRLHDLGVSPFLIASSIVAIIAQRLVRKLCDHCKSEYTISETTEFRFKHVFGDIPIPKSYHATGCKKCSNTGFDGRVGIFEFLKLDSDIRQMIIDKKSDILIKSSAVEKGMVSVSKNGLKRVAEGVTSLEELLRVVSFG